MKKQRVIVLRTAGTNCDIETCHAFKTVGGEVYLVHINELFSKRKYLAKYDILAIPGGFSYGDDIAAGRILGNELRYKLYKDIKAFASSGKPVLGICNGFQVLVKSGLLPGFDVIDETQQVTLGWNDIGKFECRWVYLKRVESRCIFTKNMPDIIYLPIAHAEGKFMVKGQAVMDRLKENQQVVFKYVDKKGIEAPYPYNPNGSMDSIAGISNTKGNVFGMMPHPERFIVKYQHPRWTREKLKDEGDGLIIFRNAVEYAANRT